MVQHARLLDVAHDAAPLDDAFSPMRALLARLQTLVFRSGDYPRLHPYGCEVCAMWPICAPISAARGGAGDKFGEIQPPCMTPLVYAAGSREHRNYLLIDYLSAAILAFYTPRCAVLAASVHRAASALKRP